MGIALDAGERAGRHGGAGVAVRRGAARRSAPALLVGPRVDRRRAAGPREGARSASTCRGHPFAGYAAELGADRAHVARQPRSRSNDRVLVAGIVTALRVQSGRRGKMAFVTLDDGQGRAEILVYNETFDGVRALLREDQLVVVEVRVMQRVSATTARSQGLRIIAEAVYDLAALRKRWAKGLKLACNGNASADRLAEILRPFRPGEKPVTIAYRNDAHRR